ncbi:hypothetical protein [Streptomyces sp. KR55]|uniref:hypothetical protein n=1 Tax=Streptomyces sp. KR55 TaxID=3457425 RepID=UPI003FD48CD3
MALLDRADHGSARDWWTPLVPPEAFYGIRRFDAFQEDLGIARNTLTDRLLSSKLVVGLGLSLGAMGAT